MNDTGLLTISVVTPSYKQPDWLRLCAASVADQAAPGLSIEHIVQDSLSGPSIAEAVSAFPHVKLVSEKDAGMYDAINRGWEKATGDIYCWLNCDEQYLPGTLAYVAGYFQGHPATDVLFGDAIVVDDNGNYCCSRQVLPPALYHSWTCHLSVLSCAAFFRGEFLRRHGLKLDARWRISGDAEFMLRVIRAGARMAVARKYFSAFVDNGKNLGLGDEAMKEHNALISEAPAWAQRLKPVWRLHHRLRRFFHGLYRPPPFSYDLYTRMSPRQRVRIEVPHATFYWRNRIAKN